MEQSKSGETQKKQLFFGMIVFLLIFLIAARTPLDGDMWWHLRSGEVTLQERSVLLDDGFSFSRNGQGWINHSWLGQVILFFAFDHFGYWGLSLLVALTAAAGFYFVHLQTRGMNLFNSFVLLLGAMTASTVWSPRPQIFTLLCFSICSYVLYIFRENGFKKLWVLLPLFVLWSNLHGGYPLGLMLIGLVFVGELFNQIFGERDYQKNEKDWKLLLWLILCFLVVLLNPNGINTWKIPFQTLDVNVLQELISEWASPDFHQPISWLFLIMLFGGFFFMILSRKEKDYVDILVYIWFAFMALMARRNFGPFVYAGIPIVCKYGNDFLVQIKSSLQKNYENSPRLVKFLNQNRNNQPSSEKISKIINLFLISILALVTISKLVIVSHPVLVSFYESQLFPKEAVQWLENNTSPGNILNEYNWGGYLIWHLPDYQVFVDGRTDLYGDEIITEWLEFLNGGENIDLFLEKWKIDYLLLQPDRSVVSDLLSRDWEKIYEDEKSVILQP